MLVIKKRLARRKLILFGGIASLAIIATADTTMHLQAADSYIRPHSSPSPVKIENTRPVTQSVDTKQSKKPQESTAPATNDSSATQVSTAPAAPIISAPASSTTPAPAPTPASTPTPTPVSTPSPSPTVNPTSTPTSYPSTDPTYTP
ncbi:MAG: hypothetical protein H6797_03375 [Candidatus Nomurabacteria bacterium]|nr:MAG: hypothetical protein H6797_03375 [Candidatus Nomurabacteria bacterium]